jgi:hypothetical protein
VLTGVTAIPGSRSAVAAPYCLSLRRQMRVVMTAGSQDWLPPVVLLDPPVVLPDPPVELDPPVVG